MSGGAGDDNYFVDDAGDQVVENAGEGFDTVYSGAHIRLSANVERRNLLDGGGGVDTMYGGAGNDNYFVDNALDRVVENAGEGSDFVFSSVSYILPTNVENLVLQGSENASGTGNALANSIYGNSGNNWLDGQGGADVLTGNGGNDTFVFVAGQTDGDLIVDFTGNGANAGDSLRLFGYGPGATFTNIDAFHWQVNYNSGASHEVIAFMNGAAIDQSDWVFV